MPLVSHYGLFLGHSPMMESDVYEIFARYVGKKQVAPAGKSH